MDEKPGIKKNRKLFQSMDYEFLRSEGLKYIEGLASEQWTDYNSHDPGITILEALCYAITELGYRCSFEMKDLLTKELGGIEDNQIFFTAKKILTNSPLTINDYRKLLIDIEGVHNAWLIAEDKKQGTNSPVNEIPVYANCLKDELQTEPVNEHPLFLNGLYRVLLDLDYNDKYGDLNNGDILIENPDVMGMFSKGEFLFSIELPSWKDADFNFASAAKDESRILSSVITKVEGIWKCFLRLTDNSTIIFYITIPKKPAGKAVDTPEIETMFDATKPEIKIFIAKFFKNYYEKISMAKKIVQTAVKSLHEHRNLCEDFLSVSTIDDEEIAFCFDVDVKPEADIEKIQAEMFYVIENYLNPSVDFYSLKELLNENIPVDEIFDGIVLTHGFIKTLQLENTQLRSVIHTSDIINLLMDIEGVNAVRNFMMSKYDTDGKIVSGFKNLKWCMEITPLHKPVLSADKSKILLFKNQFPFIARYDEVHDTVLLLHSQKSLDKLKGLQDDITIPEGNHRDTQSYWPVQYDFPITYGIGEVGLPLTATPQRIAQQRQLKGYLMFYEQLLADFFSQLTNVYKLYSVDDIKQTYYAQFLENIKDIDPVYNINDPPGILRDVLAIQDSTTPDKNGWQQLYEPKYLFEERRNRFLDHMLARFAESFSEYAMLMYRINYNEKTEEKIEMSELISAKIKTLKEYDIISSKRGTAFNYFPQLNDFTVDSDKLWNTDNVSGIEKRISFLTGIKDYTRRYLNCIRNITINCEEETVKEHGVDIIKCFHRFSLTSLSGITMISKRDIQKKSDAEIARDEVISSGQLLTNYKYDPADKKLKLYKDTGELLMESKDTFPDGAAALSATNELASEFKNECNDPVGLHLIEHILLRPREKDYDLMQVCLHDCECVCELDPYTFRVSVVLPSSPGHFDDMAFRQYFENKIREEAPAHVSLKICWLNNESMRRFEVSYRRWIEALADYSFDKTLNNISFRNANDAMLDILSQLHSEYPPSTLHDCEESKDGNNPVLLGKTVLGNLNNT